MTILQFFFFQTIGSGPGKIARNPDTARLKIQMRSDPIHKADDGNRNLTNLFLPVIHNYTFVK
jgi:hypothetical protein